jgi:hypothetical protein
MSDAWAGTSGTRLHVQTLTTADGLVVPTGILDSTLNAPCTFMAAADGVTRCLPAGAATDLDLTNGTATPATFANTSCPPKYIVVSDPGTALNACQPPVNRVFSVGQQVTSICVAWQGGATGQCSGTRTANAAGTGFYLAGSEVDPSTFAGAQSETVMGAARLQVQRWRGSDGSLQPFGVQDTQLGSACSFQTATDGKTRCLPTTSATGGDLIAGQSTPVLEGNTSCAPKFIVSADPAWQAGSCQAEDVVVASVNGQKSSICVAWSGTGASGGCIGTQTLGSANEAFFEGGAPADPSMFVAATSKQVTGQGRLSQLLLETADGFHAPNGLQDKTLGIPCAFARAADGAFRCLPTTVTTTIDVTAGVPTPVLAGNSGCPPQYIVAPDPSISATSCQAPQQKVFKVGPPKSSICTSWTGEWGGNCMATQTLDAPGAVFFTVGDEVPASTFAATNAAPQ